MKEKGKTKKNVGAKKKKNMTGGGFQGKTKKTDRKTNSRELTSKARYLGG